MTNKRLVKANIQRISLDGGNRAVEWEEIFPAGHLRAGLPERPHREADWLYGGFRAAKYCHPRGCSQQAVLYYIPLEANTAGDGEHEI